MNAAELHQTLGIELPFKEWAAAQIKAGKEFKPFFGKLADGKLGKNYTLSQEVEVELVAQHKEPEAERKAGEMLRDMPKAKGTRGNINEVLTGAQPVGAPVEPPKTLQEQGINYNQSVKWQAMAAIPEDTVIQIKSGAKTVKAAVLEVKKQARKAAPRDETPYSVLSYNETILSRIITDKEARKAGISLAHIARNREIEPGKIDHPVWKQVNTWPKWMFDRYYAKSLAKKGNEPEQQESAQL
jgi:hypothetical protein